ncbi:MAG TPA: hypothetical protein PKA29_01060 [Candidatus Saccharibacteria bacterium]|nr:hypothetical protein [Candidatus Saccharibacteria bacterium]
MQEDIQNKVIIYQGNGADTKVRAQLESDTVWLTQAQLVALFQSSKANISEHIKNIYSEGELAREATVREFRTVQNEGEYKKYQAKTLSSVEKAFLDAIAGLEKTAEVKLKEGKGK